MGCLVGGATRMRPNRPSIEGWGWAAGVRSSHVLERDQALRSSAESEFVSEILRTFEF